MTKCRESKVLVIVSDDSDDGWCEIVPIIWHRVNHHPGNELNVCSDPDIGDTPEKNLIREKHRDTDLFTDNEGDKYVGTRKKYLHQTLEIIFVCVCVL